MVESMGISPGSASSILVVAGAGGVGSIVTQVAARVLNLTVVATASRPESVEFCKANGAHHVINHREPLKPQLEKLGLQQVNYVMNCADWGDEQMSQWADCLAPLGKIATILPPKSAIEAGTFGKLF